VRSLTPIAGSDESLSATADTLERQVLGMQRNLAQFRPTIALGRDARLMYVMAEDPNADTSAIYPTVYARPVLDDSDNLDASTRFARISARAEQLKSKMRAFTVQHVPGQGMTSLQAHAVPLGFMPVRGCDPNWNGASWTVTRGKVPVSNWFPGQEDIELPQSDFPGQSGLLFLAFHVNYQDGDALRIEHVAVGFNNSDVLTSTGMAFDPKSNAWQPGVIISPLHYLLAPKGDRKAPVVLRMGGGEAPTSHDFMRPHSQGGLVP